MSPLPVCAAPAAVGVYKPRRPQASPLFRLVSDHFRAFYATYEDRFAATTAATDRAPYPNANVADAGGVIHIPTRLTFLLVTRSWKACRAADSGSLAKLPVCWRR